MSASTVTSPSCRDPWRASRAIIRRIGLESPGVQTYDLSIEHTEGSDDFQFAPGQFNMLYLPGIGESAISISGRTREGYLQHTIRTVGAVTRALQRAGKGASLGLRGPFGTSWPVDQLVSASQPMNLILVAGGIGIAPLRSVIEYVIRARKQIGRIDLLMGARTPADLIYTTEFDDWAEHDIRLHTTVDRADIAWGGHVGVVTLLLDRLAIPNPLSTVLMTCGPEVMMRFVVQSAIGRGVPESNIWVTLERNMNCAIGLCGHCQLGPEFICKDGPVFRYDRIAPWLHVQGL